MNEENKDLENEGLDQEDKEPTGEDINWETEAHKARARANRYYSSHKELQGLKREQAEAAVKAKAEAKEEKPNEAPKEIKEFNDIEVLTLDNKNVPEEDRTWLFDGFKEYKKAGGNLRQYLGLAWVQGELSARSTDRVSKNAMPDRNNRAGAIHGGTADNWLEKIRSGQAKLSDIPDTKMRSEVVNLRLEQEKDRAHFKIV